MKNLNRQKKVALFAFIVVAVCFLMNGTFLAQGAAEALGDDFDVRLFHQAVIGSGAMPLKVLGEQIDRFIAGEDVAARRVLKIDDYERWRQVTSPGISDDGAWVTFGYRRPNAFDPEVELHVKSLRNGREYQISQASEPRFSDDSRWVAFFIDLPFDEAEKLRAEGNPRPRQVRLLDLTGGEERTWQNADSFSFSSGSGFLAVKKARPADRDGANAYEGTELILRDLGGGSDRLIGSVAEFTFNDRDADGPHADMLAYTVDAADRAGNGLYVIDLSTGVNRPLDTDSLIYSRLTWDAKGRAVATLKGDRPDRRAERENVLLAFVGLRAAAVTRDGTKPARRADDPPTAGKPRRYELNTRPGSGFPADMVISERGRLSWNEDQNRVFFGIKEQEEVPDKPEHPDRIANVDIWHWQDPRIQSVQMMEAEADRQFTYRAAFDLNRDRFVRLTDESMRSITLTQDGKWGIGKDERAYLSDWKESQADYYRVDTTTGERTMLLKAQGGALLLSPDSKSFLYWRGGNFWLYRIEVGETTNLTASAPRSLINQEAEHAGIRPPYGLTGWTQDGTSVVLRHRYDLWLQPLDGSPATNLTRGVGAEREIRFRHLRIDPDVLTIDLSKPLLLSAYGQWTKKAGFYELKDGKLRQLVYEDRLFGTPLKAKDADRYLYTMETFVDFPNLHVSDGGFSDPERITDANPWQYEYRWGKRILFDFENGDGVRLQGTLAIPDDYQPSQRRPMLVQFYEKNSQNLHHHISPLYTYSWNWLMMEAISKGYLYMQPDIHINIGSPHADMLKCVEAATRKVIEMGYADPERIGLHGSSYSGQGAAYIAARSTMFAAVAAGAAATDLTGDFNRFWGWTPTNLNGPGYNGHSYDILGHGRLGTNPYDDPELYRREAPITHARTIDTPLLMMHGGSDTNVGVMGMLQLYNGMRFNGKNIIALLYPGEFHGLRNVANRRDLTIRTQQFFDHYLRDAPAPEWMVAGVPFLKKEHGAWERGRGR